MRKKAAFPGIRFLLSSVFEGFICISGVCIPSIQVWNHHSVIRDFSEPDRPLLVTMNHLIPLQRGKTKTSKTKLPSLWSHAMLQELPNAIGLLFRQDNPVGGFKITWQPFCETFQLFLQSYLLNSHIMSLQKVKE